MRVFFRTDASLLIGSGHIMRCLTLAEELRDVGAEVHFMFRAHPGNLNGLIWEKGFQCHELPGAPESVQTSGKSQDSRSEYADWLGVSQQRDAAETIKAIGNEYPDWLIVDHYGLDEEWEKLLRPHIAKIMVIDDLADRRHDCDLLLDQNFFIDAEKRYDELASPSCTKFLGPNYALLRNEFSETRKLLPSRSGEVKRVFVFLGGVDSENLSAKVLEALSTPELAHLAVDIVIGKQNPNRKELDKLVAVRDRTTLHVQIQNIAELMGRADLAVGAGGSTTWERLCLGLPTIVIAVAENQISPSKSLHQEGIVSLIGDQKNIHVDDIRKSLSEMIRDETGLKALSKKAAAMVNGEGARKVAQFLTDEIDSGTLIMRKATVEDCTLYWHWANDPDVRQSAFHREPITWDHHQKWFQKMLNQTDVDMFVMDSPFGPVGQLRLEGSTAGKIISYSLGRQFRGRGLGMELIKKAMLESAKSKSVLIGEVKKSNTASVKTFQKLGFQGNEDSDKNAVIFKLDYSNQAGKYENRR
jgi:UDP-2,4-diacetamido-2,4,6-trideoxy-beta-L-altropyranose hydrolase